MVHTCDTCVVYMVGLVLQPHTLVHFKQHMCVHEHTAFTLAGMFLHNYVHTFVYISSQLLQVFSQHFSQLSYNTTIINIANAVAQFFPYRAQAELHHAVEDMQSYRRSRIKNVIASQPTYYKKVLSKSHQLTHHRRQCDAYYLCI